MSNNVRVEFVSVSNLSSDGISVIDSYLALRVSIDGLCADITAFNNADTAKIAIFEDIDEVISTHCSQDEYEAISAVLSINKGFWFYDNFVNIIPSGIQMLKDRVPMIESLEYVSKADAIKVFIDKANETLNDEQKIELQEWLEETHNIEVRICSECGKLMASGYCIGGGDEYYCTDECLEENMTREEFNDLYDDGEGDSYHTDWWE